MFKGIELPIYLPDATQGAVRSLTPADLAMVGTQAVVVNTYHILLSLGLEVLEKFGGIAKFMQFPGLIVSDSGGFQIMSLIHQKKTWGRISEKGLEFKWRRRGRDEKIWFTPESSIAAQFAIGADIIICLDYFTNPQGTPQEQALSVELTQVWAERSKAEFARQVKLRKLPQNKRPSLMGVLQGGMSWELRRKSAEGLVKTGFDLYGYGGWPVNEAGEFDQEMSKFNASLTPDDKPRFGLGVGKPEDIVNGVKFGYQFFDCVLPTRDARHGRLYVFNDSVEKLDLNQEFYHFLYINSEKHRFDKQPIDAHCQCPTCRQFSRAYLYHLFKVKESLAWRLSTIHNLFFYNQLIARLRIEISRQKLYTQHT
jgi:queuine tRNA-ribosyltransferase